MKYSTILFVRDLPNIGGIQTCLYTLARMYKDRDLTVMYMVGEREQIKRIQKYVRVIQWHGQEIECKRIIFNLRAECIDSVKADEYWIILHGDYTTLNFAPFTHPKIDRYFSVSRHSCKGLEKITGYHFDNIYNPILVDKPQKVMHLVSATRLTAEKGRERMEIFSKMLDDAGIRYQWLVFTNDSKPFSSPNVIVKKNRLEGITDYIADADYLVQLSSSEGLPYSVYESLMLGTPVIVTDLPCYQEMGVNETNGFIFPLDMKGINVKEIYRKAGKFKFKIDPLPTEWDKMILNEPSNYVPAKQRLYTVRALPTYKEFNFFDLMLKRVPEAGEEWVVDGDRLEILLGENVIKKPLVEVVKEG